MSLIKGMDVGKDLAAAMEAGRADKHSPWCGNKREEQHEAGR